MISSVFFNQENNILLSHGNFFEAFLSIKYAVHAPFFLLFKVILLFGLQLPVPSTFNPLKNPCHGILPEYVMVLQ